MRLRVNAGLFFVSVDKPFDIPLLKLVHQDGEQWVVSDLLGQRLPFFYVHAVMSVAVVPVDRMRLAKSGYDPTGRAPVVYVWPSMEEM